MLVPHSKLAQVPHKKDSGFAKDFLRIQSQTRKCVISNYLYIKISVYYPEFFMNYVRARSINMWSFKKLPTFLPHTNPLSNVAVKIKSFFFHAFFRTF